jgi:hypothetical protein
MKKVLLVARQWSDFIVFLVVNHTNNAFGVSTFARFKLLFNYILQNICAGWLPVCCWVSRVTVCSQDLRSKANHYSSYHTTLAHSEVTKTDKESHDPGCATTSIGAWSIVWPEYNIAVD